jgi:hypothetical protein
MTLIQESRRVQSKRRACLPLDSSVVGARSYPFIHRPYPPRPVVNATTTTSDLHLQILTRFQIPGA